MEKEKSAERVDATSSSRFSDRGEDAASTGYSDRGGDAASTTETDYLWFDPRQPIEHVKGGFLPHWRQDGVVYFMTWRTADSMPRERVLQWVHERDAWLVRHPRPHDAQTSAEYDLLFSARWDKWLDESHGECLLRQPEIKSAVTEALQHFNGNRYNLIDFTVAPNHVHVLVVPLGNWELSNLEQNWKSFAAHKINRIVKRKGSFWEKESFDHIVRSGSELERIQEYIKNHSVRVDATSSSRCEDCGGDAASTERLDCGGDAASTGATAKEHFRDQ